MHPKRWVIREGSLASTNCSNPGLNPPTVTASNMALLG
jgi:hypothetical protein